MGYIVNTTLFKLQVHFSQELIKDVRQTKYVILNNFDKKNLNKKNIFFVHVEYLTTIIN